MSAVRRSDGVLSARLTLELLASVAAASGRGVQSANLANSLLVRCGASPLRTHNTIHLLQALDLLGLRDSAIELRGLPPNRPEQWRQLIARAAASELVRRMRQERLASSLVYRSVDRTLWLNSHCAPGADDGFITWIIEFEVAKRDVVGDRLWKVDPSFEAPFWSMLRDLNDDVTGRRYNADAYARLRDRQAEQGRRAEEYVVEWERARLHGHPSLGQVRRISDEHVGEGYDVLSFSSPDVLVHDLYIEVKSYSVERRFFWTANEVEVAKLLGERYALYLVDISQLVRGAACAPDVIRGPYAALIEVGLPGWTLRTDTYECIAPPRAASVTRPASP